MIIESENEDGMVLGSVWISGFQFARDCTKLRQNAIGAILSAIDLHFEYPGMEMQRLVLNIEDECTQDIEAYYDSVFDFIEKARQNTNVLVHCAGGISRSAALLISYMMRKFAISYDAALSRIQKYRKIAQPNQGF